LVILPKLSAKNRIGCEIQEEYLKKYGDENKQLIFEIAKQSDFDISEMVRKYIE